MLTDEKYQKQGGKSNLQWYLGISEQPGREKVKIKNHRSLRSLVINLHLPIARYSSILLSDVKK